MKTELTQTDKEYLENAKQFIASANFLRKQAEVLIRQATNDLLQELAKELKWEEMSKIAFDLPESTEKFYAIQYSIAVKEEWERKKIPDAIMEQANQVLLDQLKPIKIDEIFP